MLVQTIKKHWNTYGDAYEKAPPKQYEVPDREGENLIASGLVEKAPAPAKPVKASKGRK